MVFIGLIVLALLTGIASGMVDEERDNTWLLVWNSANMYVIMAATCFLVAQKCL
jgi:hypothetical protein